MLEAFLKRNEAEIVNISLEILFVLTGLALNHWARSVQIHPVTYPSSRTHIHTHTHAHTHIHTRTHTHTH